MQDLTEYYNTVLGLEPNNLRLMKVDPNLILNDHQHYQRYRIEDKVLHRMKHWDKDYNFGILALRPDGYYFTINGQHHADAAVRLGVTEVNYYVFDSTGWEEEKVIFETFTKLQAE